MDTHKTKVVFRRYRAAEDRELTGASGVIALFPDDVEPGGLVGCYVRKGQHGSADYGLVLEHTTPASPEEYADLKEELESIGYNLKIVKRR
jgi:hypothetical protein